MLEHAKPAVDDLFSDAETGTTWSLLRRAIDGPLAGSLLETLLHGHDFWGRSNREAPVYGESS